MIYVEKVSNGYVVTSQYQTKTVCKTLEEVFGYLLLKFEGKSRFFGGCSYGYVHIFREPDETITSPAEVEPA